MKKIITAILMAMICASCGSDSSIVTLKDLTKEVKKLEGAPRGSLEGHWAFIEKQMYVEAKRFNVELEGYSIPTISEIDGIEVVWPAEIYGVEFHGRYFNVRMLCKIRLTKDIHEDEISNKIPAGYGASLLQVIGMDGNEACAYITNFEHLRHKEGDYRWENKKTVYVKGTEMILPFDVRVEAYNADDFERISKIILVDGRDERAEQLIEAKRNKYRQ